jgi:replication factor C subunit 3/5
LKSKIKTRVIVVKEADRLSKEAQSALRRTMEKYMRNCRLIMCCNHISKLIAPIRSRCVAIRVASPTTDNIIDTLNHIVKEEGLTINRSQLELIIELSGRNMRKAINTLQLSKSMHLIL